MDDLVAFLNARLDEREAGAWSVHDVAKCDWLMYEEDLAAGAREGHCDCGEPDRVRREVAAKRAHIRAWETFAVNFTHVDETVFEFAKREALEGVLEQDAAVYSDHPDYRPEWKP